MLHSILKPNDNMQSGFTLIEVLAALVVFSVAIIGLTRAGAQSARTTALLEDKTIAGIVADNQLVLLSLTPPVTGTRRGETSQMLRAFNYEIITRTTEVSGLYEHKVRVRLGDGPQILAERVTFRAALPATFEAEP